MSTKRKDDTSVTSAAKPAEESNSKKTKYAKEDPGMTSDQFIESAKNIPISLGEDPQLGTLTAEPTIFSSGSYGWKANSKIRVNVNVDGEDKEVQVMVGLNLTVSGSKPDVKKVTNGKRGRPRKHPLPENTED